MSLRTIIIIVLMIVSVIAIAIIYLGTFEIKEPCNQLALPGGYTCTNFNIVEVIEGTSCRYYTDCTNKLPTKYLMMSNCPYQAICLANKCAVVCPNHK